MRDRGQKTNRRVYDRRGAADSMTDGAADSLSDQEAITTGCAAAHGVPSQRAGSAAALSTDPHPPAGGARAKGDAYLTANFAH